MAAGSLAEFAERVLRVDELFHDGADDSEASVVPRRALRDRINPLEHFSDGEFLSRYRFSKDTVRELLKCLPMEESVSNRGHPLPPMLQLAIALRFYGSGTFQVVTGDLVNVSQPTVCRAVERVSTLIAAHMFPRTVKFPATAAEFQADTRDFYRLGRFPGVTGCIDCTHIRIKSPGGQLGEVYRNRKVLFDQCAGNHRAKA
ncbi:hypothetical protein V5799_006885 [Amblyomma americanum]|uniref:Nuclease HARBI1 n=1 Tax=Amblyomma americanum TaxID=6943 RepID=A0AAQ4DV45_AMBAM